MSTVVDISYLKAKGSNAVNYEVALNSAFSQYTISCVERWLGRIMNHCTGEPRVEDLQTITCDAVDEWILNRNVISSKKKTSHETS